jgi:hypothetical protein
MNSKRKLVLWYNQFMAKNLKVNTGAGDGCTPPAYWKELKLAVVDQQCPESLSKWAGVLGLSVPELLASMAQYGPVVRDIRRGLLQSVDDSQDQAA